MASKVGSRPVKVILAILALGCLLFGVFLGGTGAWFVWKGFKTRSWGLAQGTVDISRLKTEAAHASNRSGSRLVDVAEIGYYFTVHSRHYRGDRVSTFDLRVGRNTARAKALLARYPLGVQVQVSYDPYDPNHSVLEPGIKRGAWMMFGFGLLLIAMHFLLRRFLGRAVRNSVEAS